MPASPLKLELTLKGRPIREYTFSQDIIAIGRDPQADVFLDNMGVSRNQARILRLPAGWVLEDQRSANGTWLNGRRVERERLNDHDEVTIGKFALRVGLAAQAEEPAAAAGPSRSAFVPAIDGTTVLTKGQLARVLEMARDANAAPSAEELQWNMAQPSPTPSRGLRRWMALAIIFSIAATVGAALTALLMR